MLEKSVPVGGQTAVFWGPWRVLGGFPLLDRFRCRLPPPFWVPPGVLLGAFGRLLAAKLLPKTHPRATKTSYQNRGQSSGAPKLLQMRMFISSARQNGAKLDSK